MGKQFKHASTSSHQPVLSRISVVLILWCCDVPIGYCAMIVRLALCCAVLRWAVWHVYMCGVL